MFGSDTFFEHLDVLLPAVDSVEAREFIDTLSLFYSKSMLGKIHDQRKLIVDIDASFFQTLAQRGYQVLRKLFCQAERSDTRVVLHIHFTLQ